MGQERVGEGPGALAGPRMDDEAGRFVQDQDVGVFVDHIERQAFSDQRFRRRGRHVHDDALARLEPRGGLHRAAVHAHVPLGHERLEARPRDAGQLRRQPQVEPAPRRAGLDDQALGHQAGRGAFPVTSRRARSATPMLIAESATLKAGQ